MKVKPIAHVVLEYFQKADHQSGTVNEILKYFAEQYGKDNPTDIKKARHAIYLKANRLVKAGKLQVLSKRGNTLIYGLNQRTNEPKTSIESSECSPLEVERSLLLQRQAELEYEIESCIAEAKGYEEIKTILPSRVELLDKQKLEAKKKAIHLNGLLTSTQKTLRALS